eukprot:scaffold626_cov409-Prasinococcus_capsulatus_cf.AAC.32
MVRPIGPMTARSARGVWDGGPTRRSRPGRRGVQLDAGWRGARRGPRRVPRARPALPAPLRRCN